ATVTLPDSTTASITAAAGGVTVTYGGAMIELPATVTSVTGYTAAASATPFTSILGNPSAVVLMGPGNDDTSSASTPLPLAFSYFGAAKSTFQANANGFLAFDQALGAGFFTNVAVPNAGAPNDMIDPWWDDLHTGVGGSVLYDTVGGSLIVEW